MAYHFKSIRYFEIQDRNQHEVIGMSETGHVINSFGIWAITKFRQQGLNKQTKGSFTYYVINFLAFLPPPPPKSTVIKTQPPPLTVILRYQGLTPQIFGQFLSMDTLPAVRAALKELYVLKRIDRYCIILIYYYLMHVY